MIILILGSYRYNISVTHANTSVAKVLCLFLSMTNELYWWHITWYIWSKAFTLILPTLMVIVSPGRQKKITKNSSALFFKWCEIGLAQSQCTELVAQVLLAGGLGHQLSNTSGRFEEKMHSHLFSPPFTEAKWLDFQRGQASLAPTDFGWNDNCVSLLGPLLGHFTKLQNYLQAPDYTDSFLSLSPNENMRP